MKKFLKENFVLMVGISLPVLLVIFFSLASVVPKMLVEPPKAKVLFSFSKNYSNNKFDVKLVDGRVKASIMLYPYDMKENRRINIFPKLYIFDPVKGKSEILNVDFKIMDENYTATDVPPGGKWFDVEVTGLENIKLNDSKVSPDGYEFSCGGGYRNAGLFSDVFFWESRGRNGNCSIDKNGYKVPIPETSEYYYDSVKFIGWVVE